MNSTYHNSGKTQPIYLKDASKADEHWDTRKNRGREVGNILASGDKKQQNKSERVSSCANFLLFGLHKAMTSDEIKHKLREAKFCHVRLEPLCQARRSLVWKARMHKAYPELRRISPSARFLHLMLTVKNCPVTELRKALSHISESFNRLSTRLMKNGKIIGFIRAVEVTREMEICEECKDNYRKRKTCKYVALHKYTDICHPHVHILLAVPASYFAGRNYLTKIDWASEWKSALKADYDPVVWVETIMPKNCIGDDEQALVAAVKEVVKYSVKVDEEFLDHVLKDDAGKNWFLELDRQLAGTRAVGLGGIFKEVMKDSDPDDEEMINPEDEKELVEQAMEFRQYFFDNRHRAYVLNKILSETDVDLMEKKEEFYEEKTKKKKERIARGKKEFTRIEENVKLEKKREQDMITLW